MLPCRGCVGGAPGHVLPCGGAGGVGDSNVAEREDTGQVILGSSNCNTGRNGDGLQRARGDGGVAAVPPLVGHHCAIAVHHGGTPGGGGGGVCALIVLQTKIGEGEDTLGAVIGVAGVGHSARGLGQGGEGELEGGGGGCCEEARKRDEELHYVSWSLRSTVN